MTTALQSASSPTAHVLSNAELGAIATSNNARITSSGGTPSAGAVAIQKGGGNAVAGGYSSVSSASLAPAASIQLPPAPAKVDPGNMVAGNNTALASSPSMQQYGYSPDGNGGFAYNAKTLPAGWDAQTYANFKEANPSLEPNAEDTTRMKGAGGTQDILRQMSENFNSYLGLKEKNTPPNTEALYKTAKDTYGIDQKQQDVQNYTTQLNSIVAKKNADLLSVTGRGTTKEVINNEQAAINRNAAIEALPVQAQLSAAQGNLQLAQTQLDTVFKLKVADADALFKYNDDRLDSIKDFLDTKEKILWDEAKTKEQRTYDEKKTNLGLINDWSQTALKTGQSDLITQFHALDPESPTFAADFGRLQAQVKDPNVALDTQLKQAQIAASKASTANSYQNIAESKAKMVAGSGAGSNVQVTDTKGNQIAVPADIAPYVNTSSSGVNYMDASSLQGTAAEKTKLINLATQAGLKVITNKNTAADLVNIQDANSKLDTIGTIFAGIAQPNALSRGLYGIGLTKLSTMAQTNPQQAAAGALQSVGLDILKAISGVQGFRGNQTAIEQVTKHLPSIYDTTDVVNQKIDYIRQLISDRENAAVGKPAQSPKTGNTIGTGTTKNGVQFDVAGAKAAGYSDAQIQEYLNSN